MACRRTGLSVALQLHRYLLLLPPHTPTFTTGSSHLDPLLTISQELGSLGVDTCTIRRFQQLPDQNMLKRWEKAQFLLQQGFSRASVTAMIKSSLSERALLETSDSKYLALISLFKGFDVTVQSLETILLRQPRLLNLTLETVQRKLKFLEGLLGNQLKIRVRTFPRLLTISIDSAEKRVVQLQNFGLDVRSVRAIIYRYPIILGFNVESTIAPKIKLLEEQGASKRVLRNMLLSAPSFLGLSIGKILSTIVLLQCTETKQRSGQWFMALCKVSLLKPGTLESRRNLFMQQGVPPEIITKLCTCPFAFHISESLISRKIEYLVKTLEQDVRELGKFPHFLSYSLERRIIPRFTALHRKGFLLSKLSLGAVLACKDDVFHSRLLSADVKRSSFFKRRGNIS